jgi:hypothetical protein
MYPTKSQESELREWQRSCRYLWNVANQQRMMAREQWRYHRTYRAPHKFAQMKELTAAIHDGEFTPLAPAQWVDDPFARSWFWIAEAHLQVFMVAWSLENHGFGFKAGWNAERSAREWVRKRFESLRAPGRRVRKAGRTRRHS